MYDQQTNHSRTTYFAGCSLRLLVFEPSFILMLLLVLESTFDFTMLLHLEPSFVSTMLLVLEPLFVLMMLLILDTAFCYHNAVCFGAFVHFDEDDAFAVEVF